MDWLGPSSNRPATRFIGETTRPPPVTAEPLPRAGAPAPPAPRGPPYESLGSLAHHRPRLLGEEPLGLHLLGGNPFRCQTVNFGFLGGGLLCCIDPLGFGFLGGQAIGFGFLGFGFLGGQAI